MTVVGRPRRGKVVKAYAIGVLRFVVGEDDDLIRFFESLPPGKRRSGLRMALRGGIGKVKVDEIEDDSELEQAADDFLK